MNWESNAFNTLEYLNRNVALLKSENFLDIGVRNQLDSTLKEIKELCDPAYSFKNVSDEDIRYLQEFFNHLMKHRSEMNLLNNIEQSNVVKIIYNMDKIYSNERPLSHADNLGIIFALIRKTGKQFNDLIAVFLMKYYLTGNNHNRKDIRKLVEHLYNRRNVQDKLYINDLKLYMDEDYFISKINPSEKSYSDFLKSVGILPEFAKTDYFNYLFIKWLIKNNNYDEGIFTANKNYFRILTVDEKKIALAGLICALYERLNITEFEERFPKFNSLLYIETNLDKTEKEFWNIVDKNLYTDEIEELLNRAYEISVIIFSRDIITQFFDILGEDDYVTKERAEFWRGYCTSKSFKSIKVVLNESQKRDLFRKIKVENKKIIDNFIIDNFSNGANESPALIISFNQKTIVEFTKVGNATQVYNTNEPYLENLLSYKIIGKTSQLKMYSGGFDSYSGTGRIIHSFGWLYTARDLLKEWGIE